MFQRFLRLPVFPPLDLARGGLLRALAAFSTTGSRSCWRAGSPESCQPAIAGRRAASAARASRDGAEREANISPSTGRDFFPLALALVLDFFLIPLFRNDSSSC